jgi:subtilisin family serine protease
VPTTVSVRIGQRTVELLKSDTQVAVKSRVGMQESVNERVRSMARRVSVERRRTLEGFEILEIHAPAEEVSRQRTTLRNAAAVRQAVPVYHTSGDGVPFVPSGTIYLSFSGDASDAAKQDILRRSRVEIVRTERNGYLTVRATDTDGDAVESAARLQQEAGVTTAEPDLITTRRLDGFMVPSDELLSRQWHLENTGLHGGESIGFKRGADARVVAAWRLLESIGSNDVVVGVIDDGFDLGHPDLADKAIDPWDFRRNSSDVTPEPDLHSPAHGNWHGTACAGVAIGSAGAGQIVGVAPNALWIPVRMNGSISPMLTAEWFDYLTDHGAWIISCSWGAEAAVYTLPDRIAHAISRSATEGRDGLGCAVVFAAGNSSLDINDHPRSENGLARHPQVIAVSASTSMDEFADYSNFGEEIWVCAPSGGLGGWSVTTSDVRGSYTDAEGVERASGYADGDYNPYFTGTSSACPLVAGVCALLLSANSDLTAEQVRQVIRETARRIGEESGYENGHSTKFGYGCIDAESAVRAALELRGSRGQKSGSSNGRPAARRTARERIRGAPPNLFEFVIAEALETEHPTPESVARSIAASEPFLKAVRLGLAQAGPLRPEQVIRSRLRRAFSAGTAGLMFDRE